MKSYLNRREIEQVYALGTFIGWLEEHEPKEGLRRKWWKMAKSFALKVLDTYFDGLDETQLAQIVKEMDKYSFLFAYKDKMRQEELRLQKDEKYKAIPREEFYDLCDHVLQQCKGCKGDKKCNVRRILINNEVPIVNEEGECPYIQ